MNINPDIENDEVAVVKFTYWPVVSEDDNQHGTTSIEATYPVRADEACSILKAVSDHIIETYLEEIDDPERRIKFETHFRVRLAAMIMDGSYVINDE